MGFITGSPLSAAASATTAPGTVPADATTPYAPASSWAGVPANQMGPDQAFSAWGITDPNATIYTGSGSGVTMSDNQIIGALADKLNIHAKQNQNLEALVTTEVGKITGLLSLWPGSQVKAGGDMGGFLKPSGKGASIDQWVAIANQLGVATTKGGTPTTMKVTDAAGGLRMMSQSQIAALQQQLHDGGFYGIDPTTGISTAYTSGNLDIPTQQAFGGLLMATSRANGNGQNLTWQQELNGQVQAKTATGGVDTVSKAKAATITTATQAQLQMPLISQAEKLLGRSASASELAAFTPQFQAQQLAHGTAVSPTTYMPPDQSTGIQQVPGVPTATQAAAEYEMNANPNLYESHQVLNAAAMIQNAMVGNRPLNSDPNITLAARQI